MLGVAALAFVVGAIDAVVQRITVILILEAYRYAIATVGCLCAER